MAVTLRPLTLADVDAHSAGEDEETVRWLTGGYGTREGTTAYIEQLARNAEAGVGTRGFGVWLDGRLAGYVDCNPDIRDGLEDGDVNITYAVHPWARGRGLAVEAVHLICDYLRDHRLGSRAAIRVDPDNQASVRVAHKSGFSYVGDFTSTTDTHPGGTAATLSLYRREL